MNTVSFQQQTIAFKISQLESKNILRSMGTQAGRMHRLWDGVQARIENRMIEAVMMKRISKALRHIDDPQGAARHLERMRKDFTSGRKSNFTLFSTSSEELGFGSEPISVETEFTAPMRAEKPDAATLLYVAGGGFIFPPSPSQINMLARLREACRCHIVLGQHRLAPEHPFPAACEDIAAQFESLRAQKQQIVLCADTAGASVVMGALQILREKAALMPSGVLLFSPWCDLSLSGWSYITRSLSAASPFRMESAAFCARLYLGDSNPTHPHASAVYADLSGLPPLSIHTSRHDMHFDDAVKLAEHGARDGADIKMNYWDTPRHHLERLKSKDAEASFQLAARFVRQCTRTNS